ncbi:Developmental Pluripotency-Associated 5 Protein [Manis pentadactyla]|nr:Developmental Pluripotency-Associated 5 Protein [Manis pentadactyla]
MDTHTPFYPRALASQIPRAFIPQTSGSLALAPQAPEGSSASSSDKSGTRTVWFRWKMNSSSSSWSDCRQTRGLLDYATAARTLRLTQVWPSPPGFVDMASTATESGYHFSTSGGALGGTFQSWFGGQ